MGSPQEVIVLDTGTWIWWVSDPDHLSRKARRAIDEEEGSGGLVVSAISIWEVALKQDLGKLDLDRDIRSWVSFAVSYPGIRVEPLTAEDSLESVLLPGDFHPDPADRFIVAMARRLGVAVITADRRIRGYEHVKTVW